MGGFFYHAVDHLQFPGQSLLFLRLLYVVFLATTAAPRHYCCANANVLFCPVLRHG